EIWERLRQRGVRPAGLGARDTLRIEVCYPLYGNELSEDRGPIEAGLGWCCKEDTDFIGAAAVRAVRAAGPAEKLAPFKLTAAGRRVVPRGSALSPGARLGSRRGRYGRARDHLARPERARRGRLLRAAGDRDAGQPERALCRGRVGQGRLRGVRPAVGRGGRG